MFILPVLFVCTLLISPAEQLRCSEYKIPHVVRNGKCYVWSPHLFLNFVQAKSHCEHGSYHGASSLATFNDLDELQTVSNMIEQGGSKTVDEASPWIGMERVGTCTNATYDALQWMNGSDIGPLATQSSWWESHEPNDCAQKAVILAKDGGRLMDKPANEFRTFICQFDEPPENTANCSHDLYATKEDGNKCYVLVDSSVNFDQAKIACADGSHGFYGSLALPTYENLQSLTDLIDSNGVVEAHVGIERVPNNNAPSQYLWKFVDGRFADLDQVGTLYRRAFSNAASVAYMHPNYYLYDDYMAATTARHIMCEFDTTKYPDSCDDSSGFYERNGTRCFHVIFHLTAWLDAQIHCEKGAFSSKGYTGYLAMPHTMEAKAAMTKLAKRHLSSYGYHTGLYRSFGNCAYTFYDSLMYVDGTVVRPRTAPFKHNQPTSCAYHAGYLTNQEFVKMYYSGYNRYYLCGYEKGCREPIATVEESVQCLEHSRTVTYRGTSGIEGLTAIIGQDRAGVRYEGQCSIQCSHTCYCKAYTYFRASFYKITYVPRFHAFNNK